MADIQSTQAAAPAIIRRADYRVAGLRDTLTSVIETSGLLEQQPKEASLCVVCRHLNWQEALGVALSRCLRAGRLVIGCCYSCGAVFRSG